MSLKTHFDNGTGNSLCGRGKGGRFLTDVANRVTCDLCRYHDEFVAIREAQERKAEEAFNAQEPRTIVPQFGRVNADGVMECYKCSGVLFRERPRSLFSYHYVCAACGTSMHPMTETGMST
jgi:DNA-directed RNA polymerase subunit RPC12/RpoP